MKIICDWENCNEIGAYKAPVEKDNSRKYRLLCLNHIKIFNKNWNYFENMNDQEIEFFIKSDLTWHKSTKTFGSSDNFFNILWNNALDDKLNIFKSSNFRDFKKTKVSQQDKDALQVMELNDEVKWEQIQSKFKELVKKYHPDKNEGNKKFEDKLKKITLSYSQLKKTKVSQQDKDALQVMELNEEVKWEQIQSKFKELVKKYHPDKNQGNKKFEDKLKKITLAYSQLKKTLGKK